MIPPDISFNNKQSAKFSQVSYSYKLYMWQGGEGANASFVKCFMQNNKQNPKENELSLLFYCCNISLPPSLLLSDRVDGVTKTIWL